VQEHFLALLTIILQLNQLIISASVTMSQRLWNSYQGYNHHRFDLQPCYDFSNCSNGNITLLYWRLVSSSAVEIDGSGVNFGLAPVKGMTILCLAFKGEWWKFSNFWKLSAEDRRGGLWVGWYVVVAKIIRKNEANS